MKPNRTCFQTNCVAHGDPPMRCTVTDAWARVSATPRRIGVQNPDTIRLALALALAERLRERPEESVHVARTASIPIRPSLPPARG
jgi:hypothetical protein